MDADAARERILELARGEGFPIVRFAPAAPMIEAREAALARRREGDLADMAWLTEEWLVRATDPGQFLAGARSVVMVALGYRPADRPATDNGARARGRVAAYAQGRDYHRVFEKKLRRMARAMREELAAAARPTVDYGPLLERPLAALSGMGWLGKSTMLLAPGFGPWVLLGAIATDLALVADPPLKKSCGSCTRCIVACPTGAISAGGEVLDARLCISYHTIENRGPIPHELRPKFGGWIFGCDDCLESCPVGAHGRAAGYAEFAGGAEDAYPELGPLLSLTEDEFRERFRGRAIMRAKRDGFVRNVCVALGNVGDARDVAALRAALLTDRSPLVRGHAAWAIGQVGSRYLAARAAARRALGEALAQETADELRMEITLALAGLE